MKEEWRPVLRGKYEVSSLGRVRRAADGRCTFAGRNLSLILMKIGYRCVRPVVGGKNVHFYVHHLVARAFLGPRRGREVNHKDGVKTNNLPGNLEYVSHRRNMRHARSIGLTPSGSRCNRSHLTESDVMNIRAAWEAGTKGVDLAAMFFVAPSTISQIVNYSRWRDVP